MEEQRRIYGMKNIGEIAGRSGTGQLLNLWLMRQLTAITSKSALQFTSPTLPADTHKSDSERHNAQSSSVLPTL